LAGKFFIDQIFGTITLKHAKPLLKAWYFTYRQVFRSIAIKLLTKAVIEYCQTFKSAQVFPAAIVDINIILGPDYRPGAQKGRIEIIHIFKAWQREKCTGNQIDTAFAHVLLHTPPTTCIDHLDFNTGNLPY